MEEAFDPAKARQEMQELMQYRMPFGKYKGWKLTDLPVEYLLWFRQKGFPDGKLGRYLAIMLSYKGA